MSQRAISAVYMRGGTSKGVFFRRDDLPADPVERDRILLRIIGSPDPYAKQIDGMGGASSSTSKVVLVSKSERLDCDVDYLFGAVSIREPLIDWSGNCGNLTAAVGPFAINERLVRCAADGTVTVRMWQENIGKTIIAHVPVASGRAIEEGSFELDGVAFPGAEIRIEFLDPGGGGGIPLLPTGNAVDMLQIDGMGALEATLISAGNSTVIVAASSLGLTGVEAQADVNGNPGLLAKLETIRAHAAVMMGFAATASDATRSHPAMPLLVFVAPPRPYRASNGRSIAESEIDVLARFLSMGAMHHALPGTGAIALGVAAALPGTLLHGLAAKSGASGPNLRIGHPSGTVCVSAVAEVTNGQWHVAKAIVSRSARRLMSGQVFVPAT